MENILPWLYDALAVALLLHYIYGAAQRGFAATLANLVGYVVSLAVAWPLARMAAGQIYELFLREGITESVAAKLAEFPEATQLADAAGQFLEALPGYLARLITFEGRSADELAVMLRDYSSDGAQLVVDELLGPVVQGALTTVLFVVFFSLLLCIVRAITRVLRGTNSLPVIGPINSVLGGVMGLFTGTVCIYVLFLLLRLAAQITGDSLAFLNSGIFSRTYTWRLLALLDPFHLL